MTYLTPDVRQTYLPPAHRHFGRPAVPILRTHSPFAVPDGLVADGLGEDLNAQMAAVFDRMSADMKKAALARAAVTTSVGVGLMFVPVVGQVVGALLLTVNSILGAKYASEAKRVVAEAQDTLQVMAADYQRKSTGADNALIGYLKPMAIQLAISGQPLAGLGDLHGNFFSSAWRSIKKPTKKVLKVAIAPMIALPLVAGKKLVAVSGIKPLQHLVHRIEVEGQKAIDVVTGRSALTGARDAAGKAIKQAAATMEAQYQAHLLDLQRPEFQQNLVVQLARTIRADAGFQLNAPGAAVAASRKGGIAAAAGITAAIVGFVALKGGGH